MKCTLQKCAKTLALAFGACRFVERHFDTRLGQLIEMDVVRYPLVPSRVGPVDIVHSAPQGGR